MLKYRKIESTLAFTQVLRVFGSFLLAHMRVFVLEKKIHTLNLTI